MLKIITSVKSFGIEKPVHNGKFTQKDDLVLNILNKIVLSIAEKQSYSIIYFVLDGGLDELKVTCCEKEHLFDLTDLVVEIFLLFFVGMITFQLD